MSKKQNLHNRVLILEAENARLRTALHDAIRRPMGIIPESAEEFYNMLDATRAETDRPRDGECRQDIVLF